MQCNTSKMMMVVMMNKVCAEIGWPEFKKNSSGMISMVNSKQQKQNQSADDIAPARDGCAQFVTLPLQRIALL